MTRSDTEQSLTVLQAKFAAYLAWSQPFIHELVSGVGEQVRNVVICNRTENLDRFPTPQVVRFKYRFLVEPTRALRAAAYLRSNWQPDVIHAHFGWSGIRMLLLKQLLRVPLVTTFGGRDAAVQMKLPYFDQLYGLLLDASDCIVCVSQDLKDHLISAFVESKRIEVIRRGTNLDRFSKMDRSGRDPGAPLQVLMVGRLIEKKGHRFAFDALGGLAAEGHDIRLTVVGEGERYRDLRALQRELGLRDRIEFKGVQSQEGVRKLMGEADVFLHCSVTGADGDREGIPNVVVEAAATGLPVIGTRHGGIPEAVQDGVTGLLVDERDDAGLAAALRSFVTERGLGPELGRAGAERTQADFDLRKQISRYLEIYAALARELPAGSERLGRQVVPSNFARILDTALTHEGNENEFSVAELFERLVSPGGLDADMLAPEPGILARLYEVKSLIPQTVKWPAKVVAGKLLSQLIALRMRTQKRYSEQIARIDQLDVLVLEHLARGGGVEDVDPSWGAEELARYLADIDAQESAGEDDVPTSV